MKVAFLFNHDQIHQVAHALPIAVAMMDRDPSLSVTIATTNARLTREVRRLGERMGRRLDPIELGLTAALTRFLSRRLEAVLPIAKIGVYRDNLDFFRRFDALVVAEKTSLLLKTRYGLDDLKIIHTRHGAGDRAIGFDKASARFDHVLVSGPKVRDRLIRDAGLSAERLSTVGYPKFDLMPKAERMSSFADPSKPTVLYNPHLSPHLSSWFKHGQAVLEHFLRDDRYNLIFAPHVMLFHRKRVVTIDRLRIDTPGTIDQRFHEAPNIHIDLGGVACTDMTYTAAADIYLGDVSSQVYEFLHRPRPCLFLNSHGIDHRRDPNYAHWQAGEVIGDPEDLGAALDRAVAGHARFMPVQAALFQRSFDLTAERSSERAARAIHGVLAPTAPLPMAAPVAPLPQEERRAAAA